MKSIILAGAAILLLGLIGLAIPVFTTQQTREVAKLGDVHVEANESQEHVIPPLVSEGAIAVGIVLLVVGAVKR
jgi:hypothetical protein